MTGLKWTARVEWLQRQRPMWREHDAKLAAAWRRGEPASLAGDSEIDSEIDGEIDGALDNVVVLPDRGAPTALPSTD